MQCTLRKQYHVPSDLEIMETLSKDHIRLAGNPFDLQLQEFWTTMGTIKDLNLSLQSYIWKLQLKQDQEVSLEQDVSSSVLAI